MQIEAEVIATATKAEFASWVIAKLRATRKGNDHHAETEHAGHGRDDESASKGRGRGGDQVWRHIANTLVQAHMTVTATRGRRGWVRGTQESGQQASEGGGEHRPLLGDAGDETAGREGREEDADGQHRRDQRSHGEGGAHLDGGDRDGGAQRTLSCAEQSVGNQDGERQIPPDDLGWGDVTTSESEVTLRPPRHEPDLELAEQRHEDDADDRGEQDAASSSDALNVEREVNRI